MRRILNLLFFLFVSLFGFSQTNEEGIFFVKNSFKESSGEIANLTSNYISDWPMDADGNEYSALIRVRLEKISSEEAKSIKFNFPAHCPISKISYQYLNDRSEIWIFVSAVENAYIEARLDGYLTRYSITKKLSSRSVYDIVLRNNEKVSIMVSTEPAGAKVLLDNSMQEGSTPIQINDVNYGKHTLTLVLNGKFTEKEINVTKEKRDFTYDLREKKTILIDSEPSGAYLLVDDEPIHRGKLPMKVDLYYGNHRIIAYVGPLQSDTLNLNVDSNTPDKIVLRPIKKKQFKIAAVYAGDYVKSDLDIDNSRYSSGEVYHNVSLPYGTYNVRMYYQDKSVDKEIKVNSNSPSYYELKVKTRNKFTWPWDKVYYPAPVGIAVNYVNKQWVTVENNRVYKNDVWGKENMYLHGVQAGLHFQPCFSFGLGLYTGIFYEYYMSVNKDVDVTQDDNENELALNKFEEHNLYIPLHLYFRLPFAKKVALSFHGGLGVDYGCYAKFSSSVENSNLLYEDYYGKMPDENLKNSINGEYKFPERLNLSWEIFAGLRLGGIQINAGYTRGLTEQKMFEGLSTQQNKLTLGLSIVM